MAQDDRLKVVERDVGILKQGQSDASSQHTRLWDAIEGLKKECVVLEKNTYVPPPNPAFDLPADPSEIVLNLRQKVPRPAVLETIKPWLSRDFDVATDLVLKGDDFGKRFRIKFLGSGDSGGRRARKALDSLKSTDANGNTTWEKLQVSHAATLHDLYVEENKNSKQKKTELHGKKLLGALKRAHPDKNPDDFYFKKKQGIISFEWKQLAKVVVKPDETPTEVQWDNGFVATGAFNKSQTLTLFGDLVRAPETEWCL